MSEEVINDVPDADEIAEKVIECVQRNCYGDMNAFKVAEIGRDTDVWDDLGFDMLDVVQLIMSIEESLREMAPGREVEIPEDICDEVKTVGDLIDAAQRVMGVEE